MKSTHEPHDGAAGRIARWSRTLSWLASVLLILVPVAVAWIWIRFDQVAAYLPSTAGVPYDLKRVTPLMRIGGFCLNMVPGAIAMYGFWRLRRLFGLFSVGRYFDSEAIGCVQGFAKAALAYGFLAPVTRLLIALLVTLPNPVGQRVVLLRVSSDDVVIVFLGGVFFLIAAVWAKAKEISDENAQII